MKYPKVGFQARNRTVSPIKMTTEVSHKKVKFNNKKEAGNSSKPSNSPEDSFHAREI